MPKTKGKDKTTVWDIMADRVIKALENETIPWRQTWSGQMPMNYVSRRRYQGINLLMLYGGKTPYYLTRKQISDLGGEVLEDERKNWHMVFFLKTYRKENKETGVEETRKAMRYYELYNLAQTTIPAPKKPIVPDICSAESIGTKYKNPPLITLCAHDPCYSPQADEILIPPIADFDSGEDYYSTLFHELVHSTGHEKRMDRFKHGYYGNKEYSEEELVAEIGACYLRAECGIDPPGKEINKSSSAYIKFWANRLSADHDIIKRAVVAASKAVKLITGETHA